jgi:hypothetical protein
MWGLHCFGTNVSQHVDSENPFASKGFAKFLTKGGWQSHLYEVAVKDGPCRVPYGHTKNYACGCIAAPPHARLRQDYRVGQGAILKGTGLSHLADDG